jgi:hypothetical protein
VDCDNPEINLFVERSLKIIRWYIFPTLVWEYGNIFFGKSEFHNPNVSEAGVAYMAAKCQVVEIRSKGELLASETTSLQAMYRGFPIAMENGDTVVTGLAVRGDTKCGEAVYCGEGTAEGFTVGKRCSNV